MSNYEQISNYSSDSSSSQDTKCNTTESKVETSTRMSGGVVVTDFSAKQKFFLFNSLPLTHDELCPFKDRARAHIYSLLILQRKQSTKYIVTLFRS